MMLKSAKGSKMLGLGLAVSHAPSMFRGLEHWPPIHRVLAGHVPQPPDIEKETSEVLQSYIQRIDQGFEVLKAQIEPTARCYTGCRR